MIEQITIGPMVKGSQFLIPNVKGRNKPHKKHTDDKKTNICFI